MLDLGNDGGGLQTVGDPDFPGLPAPGGEQGSNRSPPLQLLAAQAGVVLGR
jgi:hypothetical protein